MPDPTPILIDADPGIDDAIAILLALASTELNLVAITTVVGNAPVANATRNALRLLHLAGRPDIPVAAGADRPLVHPPRDFVSKPSKVHGDDGLGGATMENAPFRARPGHAIDLMVEMVDEYGEDLTVIAIGPLTNVALFFALHPERAARIGHLIVMGGGLAEGGNYTAAAEFNFYSDPAAAERVFQSSINITLLSLDVTQRAVVRPADFARAGSGSIGIAVRQMLGFYVDWHVATYGTDALPMHDSLAVAYAIAPEIVTTVRAALGVAYDEGRTRGQTLVDRLGFSGRDRTAQFATEIDAERFRDLLCSRLMALDEMTP
jgi:inosine-uridine nucleoside N-ribohydrolase